MSTREFVLELSLTEQCNLRCTYCYISHANKYMSVSTLKESLPTLHRLLIQENINSLFVSFFGGEPLLNYSMIEPSVNIINEYFAKEMPYLNVSFILISNMVLLTEEIVIKLKELNVKMAWSAELSDNTARIFDDNSNLDNIISLNKKYNFLFKAKVMIAPNNLDEVLNNYSRFKKIGINPDFMAVRDDIWSSEDLIKFEKITTKLCNLYIDDLNDGSKIRIGWYEVFESDIKNGLMNGKRQSSCFAGSSGCVITSQGEFYPCARFASAKLYKIDKENPEMELKYQSNPANLDKCQECELYHVCNAGCVYSQMMNNNNPIDSVCKINKILYKQTLEIMRVKEELCI